MALKCTNRSGPPSWVMKPYPLSALNHFTVPVAMAHPSFRGRGGHRAVRRPFRLGSRAREVLEAILVKRSCDACNPREQHNPKAVSVSQQDNPECSGPTCSGLPPAATGGQRPSGAPPRERGPAPPGGLGPDGAEAGLPELGLEAEQA